MKKNSIFLKILQMQGRRKFIRNVAVGTAFMAIPSVSKGLTQEKPLIHQVYFWLKEGVSVENFIGEAKVLKDCPTVKNFYIGTPAATESRDVVDSSYSVACTLFFDSIEDEQKYQIDPLHLKFIDENSNKWSKVIVYDFVI